MALRIGMILDKEFPPDPRVENEAISLSEAGFQVHLLSLNFGGRAPTETVMGVHVHRLAVPKAVAKKLKALINTVPGYDVLLTPAIRSFVSANRIQVLHVHDLHLIGVALRANRTLRLPIVADLHENYVEALKHYRFSNTFFGRLLISIPRWERAERQWVLAVDRVVVVVEEAVRRLEGLGVPRHRIANVPNYVDVDRFRGFGLDPHVLDPLRDAFVLSYMGGFDLHRGLETTVEAMPAIVRHCPQAKLVLVGHGPNFQSLRNLARRLNVAAHVCFEGWQRFERFPSYIAASDVCLIPHLKNPHTDNTLPHKLFHYMLLGAPVIVSNCTPLQRIVNDEECGLVFESNSANELAQCVIRLYNDARLRAEMGENGRRAVLQKYNWDAASKELVRMYREMAQVHDGVAG